MGKIVFDLDNGKIIILSFFSYFSFLNKLTLGADVNKPFFVVVDDV